MGRRKSAAKALAGFSLAELQALIAQRAQAELKGLSARRAELVAELAELDAAIGAAGGAPAKRGPGRPPKAAGAAKGAKPGRRKGRRGGAGKRGPRGDGGLQAMIRKVLGEASEPMKLAAIAEKVLAAGYETSSTRFAVIVGQRLSEMKDVKKAGRGLYTMKG
jgi:hypothetical protein